MSKIRVGISGLGWAASGHIPAFHANPDCEIVAVCSSKSPEEAAAFVGHEVAVYKDYDEFLAHDGLDVVDICTPHHMHAQQAIAAAKAGKHLMIEKPIATNYEDLLAMRAAIREAGVLSTVYFELRFIPHFQLIRSILDKGLLGKVHFYEFDYYHGIGPWYGQYWWNVKKDIGISALVTAGCHALDALVEFADDEVEEVYAYSVKTAAPYLQEYEYDTTSTSIIKFKGGAVGKCTACVDCRQPYVLNVHLVGSEGTLWNDQLWTTQLPGLRKEEWVKTPTAQAESGDVLDHPYPPQVDDFMKCIAEGRDSVINFEEAFITHRVMFAIEKSLAEGRPVKLAEMPL